MTDKTMDTRLILALGLTLLVFCDAQLSVDDPCFGRQAGRFAQRGDCSIYVECSGTGPFTIQHCAPGTLFDDNTRQCVVPTAITRTDCNIQTYNRPNQNWNGRTQNWNRPTQTWNRPTRNQNWNRPTQTWRPTRNQNWNRPTQTLRPTRNQIWNRPTVNRPTRNQYQLRPRRPTGPTLRPTWQTARPSWQQWTNGRLTTRRPWNQTVRPFPNQGSQVFIDVVSNSQTSINRIDCQQLQRDVNFWLTNQARTYCRNCQLRIPTINLRCRQQRPVRG